MVLERDPDGHLIEVGQATPGPDPVQPERPQVLPMPGVSGLELVPSATHVKTADGPPRIAPG